MWGCPLQRRVLLDGAGFGGAGPRKVLATEITQGVGQAAMRGAGSWDVGPFGFGAVLCCRQLRVGAGPKRLRVGGRRGRAQRKAGLNAPPRAREAAGERADISVGGRTLSWQVLPGIGGLGGRGSGERRDVRHCFLPATRAGRPGLAAAQLGEGTPGRGAPLRGACGAAQWWRANGTRAGQDGVPPGPGTSCLRVDLRKGRASRWLMAITLVGRGERLRR